MIHVCGLDVIEQEIKNTGAEFLVSIINQDMMPKTPTDIAPEQHLKLAFNDISVATSGFVNADENHIITLIDFLNNWQKNAPNSPILFHCWAGVSRSTAGAFIAANIVRGAGAEQELAKNLRQAAPFASPNKLVISLADQYLKRQGNMVKAINQIGRGSYTYGGMPFKLPI